MANRNVRAGYAVLSGDDHDNPVTTSPCLLHSIFASASADSLDIKLENGDGTGEFLYQAKIETAAGQASLYQDCYGLYFSNGINITSQTGDAGQCTVIFEIVPDRTYSTN